jgi:hypothetical protein
MTELRVHLLPDCVINPAADRTLLPAALLGAVIPKLFESALSGVASALTKAGGDETVQISGRAIDNLYVADAQQALQLNPSLGCVLAVWFGPHDPKIPDDRVATTLKNAALVPRDASVLGAFEAVVQTMPDATACALHLRHFSVRRFIGDRHNDRRGYVVSVAFATPSAEPEGKTIALAQFDLGSVETGTTLVPDASAEAAGSRFRSNLMPWAPISAASKNAYERDVSAGRAAGRAYMPITVGVTVSETAEGSRFLLALGELLGGVAKPVAGELSKLVIEEAGGGVGKDTIDAEKLYDDELKARVDEAKARKAIAEASVEERAAAKLAWELAARRLTWRTRLREAAGLPARAPLEIV